MNEKSNTNKMRRNIKLKTKEKNYMHLKLKAKI